MDEKIATLIFDLGNVLVFFSFEKMFRQMSVCTGLSVQKIEKEFLQTSLRADYESGRVSTEELFSFFQKISPRSFTQEELVHAFSDIFEPNEPMYPLLLELKKRGHELILLSNTSEAHFKFLSARYPMLNLFDAKILSYEVGAMKPEPLIYQKALNASLLKNQKYFYTDDIPEYVEAGKFQGIDSVIFMDTLSLKKELSTRRLI